MSSHMFRKVVVRLKTLHTNITFIRSFVCMNTFVSRQPEVGFEHFTTEGARVRTFVVAVYAEMCSEIFLGFELLVACGACEFHYACEKQY